MGKNLQCFLEGWFALGRQELSCDVAKQCSEAGASAIATAAAEAEAAAASLSGTVPSGTDAAACTLHPASRSKALHVGMSSVGPGADRAKAEAAECRCCTLAPEAELSKAVAAIRSDSRNAVAC